MTLGDDDDLQAQYNLFSNSASSTHLFCLQQRYSYDHNNGVVAYYNNTCLSAPIQMHLFWKLRILPTWPALGVHKDTFILPTGTLQDIPRPTIL